MEEEYISSSDEDDAGTKTRSKHAYPLDLVGGQEEAKAGGGDAGGEDEEYYDEDEEEEDSAEEEVEYITHCVHRLPVKGQRVNLLNFQYLIEVEKVQQSPVPTKPPTATTVTPSPRGQA
jgi:hypothetical protein